MSKQAEAVNLMQEIKAQVDEAIKRLQTIPALEVFGDSIEQFDFTQAIYDLKSARTRLESSLEAAGGGGKNST
jgi:hypothetical protein